MKKLFIICSLLFLSLLASAGTTVVTGTLHDPTGQALFGGNINFIFVPNPLSTGLATVNGFPVSPTLVQSTLDSNGAFTVTVTDNTTVSPAGSSWNIIVCPQASVPCTTVTGIVISGVSMNLSTTLNNAIPNIQVDMTDPPRRIVAYSDSELAGALPGHTYFNLADQQLRICVATPCFAAPSTSNWVVLGGQTNGSLGLSVSPTSLSFGSLAINATSTALPVTITNTNTPVVSLNPPTIDNGNFTFTTTSCGTTLLQGQSCTLNVSCTPTAAGTFSGNLSIISNTPQSPQVVTLACTGQASSPTWQSAAISPLTPTLSVPNNLQLAFNVTDSTGAVTNGANQAYFITTGSTGGGGGSWLVRNHTGSTVAAGTSRTCGPMNVVTGDLLLFGAYIYNSASLTAFTSGITDTQGNVYTLEPNLDETGQHREFLGFAVAGSTGANTITGTQSSSVGYFGTKCADVTGQAAASPLDSGTVVSQNAPLSTASMTSPQFTTTQAPDFCWALFSDATGTNAPTAGTNWTALDTDSTFRAISEYLLASPIGNFQATANDVSATNTWQAYNMCFKPGATVGTPFATVTSPGGLLTAQSAGTSSILAQGGVVVQAVQVMPPTATSTVTIQLPNAQTAGNLNLARISWQTATGTITSLTDTAGNSYPCQTPEQANGLSTALCIASPIKPFGVNNTLTLTMGQSTTGLDVVVQERSFPVAVSVIDGSVVNATGASGPATLNITTVNPNDIVIVGLGLAGGIQQANAPFVVDTLYPNNNGIISAPSTSAQTLSPTITLSSGAWVAQGVALKVQNATTNATITAQAVTNVLYIAPSTSSPPGSDTNPGTQSQPLLSFAKVNSTVKANGVGANGTTVFLENGVYSPATGTGYLLANCGTGGNAISGTGASAQITFQALNERQAEIDGSTSGIPALIQNCAWWTVQGIYFKNGDFTTQPNFNYDNVILSGVSNFTFTRNILAFNNRFQNSQLLSIQNSSSNVNVTNNEFYFFHRHGTQIFGGANNVFFSMNYCNSRNYPDLSNGRVSSYPSTGDDCVITYGGSNNIVVNNVSENNGNAANCQPNGSQACNNNKYFGNVSLNEIQSFWASSHQGTTCSGGLSTSNCPSNQNDNFTNNVSIFPLNDGFVLRSGTFTVAQGSVFSPRAAAGSGQGFGVFTDIDPTAPGASGPYSMTLTNVNVVNPVSGACAYFAGSGVSGTWNFASVMPTTAPCLANISASTVTINNLLGRNNDLGSCFLWVPTASNNKGGGSGGLDIGADILFKYDSTGTVTTNPMWSASASCKLGQTHCLVGEGAIVSGLNDVPGNSLYDFGTRVNLNQNGCGLPTGYTEAP